MFVRGVPKGIKEGRLRGAWRLAAAMVLVLAATASGLPAQDADLAASLVGKFFPADRAQDILRAAERLDELKKLAANQLQIRIGGAFSENIVPASLANLARQPKELSKLNLTSSIGKGFFPYELTFVTDSIFQLEDGAIKENVTKLLLTYQYYFQKWLEGYAFVERFSDSYLSIQQRYEIGTGIKLETDSFALFPRQGAAGRFEESVRTLRAAVGDLEKKEAAYYTPELLGPMAEALANMEANLAEPGLKDRVREVMATLGRLAPTNAPEALAQTRDLDQKLMALIVELKKANPQEDRGEVVQKWLEDKTLTLADLRSVKSFLQGQISILSSSKAKEAVQTWYKKNAFLGLGLAFSFFSEVEKAEIMKEVGSDAWETVSLPATLCLRWVVRPSFSLRPARSLSLKGQFYFKNFLWAPNAQDKRSNTRQDYYLRLDYELPTDVGWAKSLTFFLAYEFHRDSNPPRIPEASLQDLAARYSLQAETINPSADKEHHVFNLGIEIKF